MFQALWGEIIHQEFVQISWAHCGFAEIERTEAESIPLPVFCKLARIYYNIVNFLRTKGKENISNPFLVLFQALITCSSELKRDKRTHNPHTPFAAIVSRCLRL